MSFIDQILSMFPVVNLPLKNRKCYLSGPIEFDSKANWRTSPCKTLKERFEINVYDPFANPKQSLTPELLKAREDKDLDSIVKIAKGFVRSDLCAVDRADFLIAYLPYKVPTTGTTHEIILSNTQKKPTLLVADGDRSKIPLWWFGFIPIEFMFDNWDHLYSYLEEVNQGKHIENNRWAYVYNLI